MTTPHASLDPAVDTLCTQALRALALDMIDEAQSGHPGLPLGAAPMAYVLWQYHLKHDPADPSWPDRDRFVLSPGHGSALLYALLHATGYDLSLDDLRAFRQLGSRTPGHPERGVTPGVEATTGPLGQGAAQAVGMALAERALAHRFNRPGHTIVDHMTYALVSDGDLMEGVAAEAASLAGHLALGKLVYLYDANAVTLDGPADLCFSEDVAKRFEAYGWQALTVSDGDHDFAALDAAIEAARADTTRPSLIVVRTTIGFGAPNLAGSHKVHGSPLPQDELRRTKQALGCDPARRFDIPEQAGSHFRSAQRRGAAAHDVWEERMRRYGEAHPELEAQWRHGLLGELPATVEEALPKFEPGATMATRQASGKVLSALSAELPWLLGGDADLSSSTKTAISDGGSFDGQTGAGRNIHFGVREHAMAAMAVGIAYHGGLHPYIATFFAFSDYMRPALRVAALSEVPMTCVFSHDSLGVGEDGPTHRPVEQLMALRVMPQMTVIRPADAAETAEAWLEALRRREGPVALVLSRQGLPVIDRQRCGSASGLRRGGYVLMETDDDSGTELQAILIATGSEVHVALEAATRLAARNVRTRVVSLPSWELFEEQNATYRDAVLPPSVRARVAIEAGVTLGWQRYVGEDGTALGVDRYGASGAATAVMAQHGITATAAEEAVMRLLEAKGPKERDECPSVTRD